jgi:lysophospholipase L1-like esterase
MPLYPRPSYPTPDFWTTFGHSYFDYSFGVYDQSGRSDAIFRATLDIEATNWRGFAANGARAQIEGQGQGGYARLLQEATKPQRGAPYVPDGGALILCYGINDLGNIDQTTQTKTQLQMALRAMISRWRASVVFENDFLIGTRVAYGAGFGLAGSTADFSSGTSVHLASTTTGATVTLTIPADYTGEVIAVQFIANAGAFGGTITFSGTAGVTGTMSTSNVIASATGSHTPVVRRITNLTSAAAGLTIVMTVSALDASGSVLFDSWWLEAKAAPPIILCNIPKLTAAGYALYPSWTGLEAAKDASVDDTNNSYLIPLVGEFDSMVQMAFIDQQLNKDSTLLFDGLHPNESGAARLSDAFRDAMNRFAPTTSLGPTANFNTPSPRAGALQIPQRSGTYVSTPGTEAVSAVQLTAQDMYAAPFVVTGGRVKFNRLAMRILTGTGAAAGTIRWGLYDDPAWSGYPRALVDEPTTAGALSTGTASGIVQAPASGTGSVAWVTDPGLYWLIFKCITAGTSIAFECITGPDEYGIMPRLNATDLTNNNTPIAYLLTGQGTGALPSFFPTSGALISSVFPKMGVLVQ